MNSTQFRAKLADANLSALSRLSGIDLRTLRRIKNGGQEARPETIAAVTPHLREARK